MVKIEKLIPGGQGLGTLDTGQKVMLWNALPGELVEDFQITKKKSSYLEGIATSVKHPSPHRVEPKDALYLSTSPWQIMDWDFELAMKRELVAESLRQAHIPLDNLEIRPTQTDNKQWHYRNKMEYALYWDNSDECIYLAFRARGSHIKLPLKPTPVNVATSPQKALEATENPETLMSSLERPELLKAALECVKGLNSRHEPARKYQSLLLRCDQRGTVSGGLFENGKPHPTFENLSDTILGQTYSYSPNGFFQINLPVYELALTEVKKWINTNDVLDLYAGVGTIGLSVARDKNLVLVECNKDAYRELSINSERASGETSSSRGRSEATAEKERATPATAGRRDACPERSVDRKRAFTVLAKSEDCLNYIQPDQTVILDPPRAGCSPDLIAKLNETKPTTIVYLSCNPTTQARDVSALLKNYKIELVQPYNFFPKTPHIENLLVLTRHA